MLGPRSLGQLNAAGELYLELDLTVHVNVLSQDLVCIGIGPHLCLLFSAQEVKALLRQIIIWCICSVSHFSLV